MPRLVMPGLLAIGTMLLSLALTARSQDRAASRDGPWWSLQPIVKPALPNVAGDKFKAWPRNPIDHFILAKLLENGMEPAPEADRKTLIRRLYFDLIGLPPAPDDIAAFERDPAPDAYEKLVERLPLLWRLLRLERP